jgi:O-antigen/teichoic acid export membrane protein
MINFITNFFKQSGIWVASSFFVSKISAFLLTIFMARILSQSDFGWVMYGLNYLGFFIPFIGLGSSHGTLRFAAIAQDKLEKEKVIQYSFSYGLLLNFLVNLIMLVLAFVIFGKGNQLLIVSVFSVRLFGFFLLDQAKAEIRGRHNNKKFGQLDLIFNLISLLSAVLFSYFFGVNGYIFSLCLSPFVVLLFHRFKFSFSKKIFADFTQKEFWRFSISMALTNQISELIFLLDVFFIGIFLNNTAVAQYRIYSVIPFNLFFLSALFFQTAYPKLCENHQNNKFQLDFLYNFWKLMLPISILILVFGFSFSEFILKFFGGDYYKNTTVFRVLLVAAVGVLFLRTPFGYLLSSKGKSNYNLIASSISVISLVVFIKPVILNFGLEGVAWLSLCNLFLIGIFQMISYFYIVYGGSKS